jgi:hypothetical protein
LLKELFIGRECREDIRLTERQPNFVVVLVVAHHKILDLDTISIFASEAPTKTYLISPEQRVPLFALGIPPDGQ